MYIPTASKLFEEYSWSSYLEDGGYATCIDIEDFEKALIDFAKLHVQAALKAASENLEYTEEDSSVPYVVESSILNAYPLENIK